MHLDSREGCSTVVSSPTWATKTRSKGDRRHLADEGNETPVYFDLGTTPILLPYGLEEVTEYLNENIRTTDENPPPDTLPILKVHQNEVIRRQEAKCNNERLFSDYAAPCNGFKNLRFNIIPG